MILENVGWTRLEIVSEKTEETRFRIMFDGIAPFNQAKGLAKEKMDRNDISYDDNGFRLQYQRIQKSCPNCGEDRMKNENTQDVFCPVCGDK